VQHEPQAGDQVPVYERSSSASRWRDWLLAGVVCLVVGAGGGFALGRTTAPSGPKTLAEAVQQAQQGKLPRGNLAGGGGAFRPGNGQNGQGGQGGRLGARGGPSLQGDVTAVNGGVLTVSTGAGSLKVQLDGSTRILEAVPGKRGDLGVGDTVAVRFDPTASNVGSGTVLASSITKEPAQ
jgi:hypothetical protein